VSSEDVTIDVRLLNLAGAITDGNAKRDDVTPIFDVNVKLEEAERRTGEAVFSFAIAINTKPSVARFDVNGLVTITGKTEAMEKMLQTDPDTKVPNLLKKVYQQIFVSIYLVSGMIGAPNPPPNLLLAQPKSE
jgi:hypothetical protein